MKLRDFIKGLGGYSRRDYIVENCPTLKKRLDEDKAKGIFNPMWMIHSDESMKYMSGLAGREIYGWELVKDTCDEIEEKLKKVYNKTPKVDKDTL